MTGADAHLTAFELDVYFADGGRDVAVQEHVARCQACASYLEHLRTLAGSAPRTLAGSAPKADVVPLPPPVAPRRRPRTWLMPTAIALGAAAAIALFIRTRPVRDDAYVGDKGGVAVQLLVRHDGKLQVWDGRASVHSGDALALRVACPAHTRVIVAAPSGERWVRLHDDPCPAEPDALPFTLVVDDAPGVEHLAVVVARETLGDDALGDGALGATIERPPADVDVARFELPKETRR